MSGVETFVVCSMILLAVAAVVAVFVVRRLRHRTLPTLTNTAQVSGALEWQSAAEPDREDGGNA
jgi:hypothetical protein